MLDLSMLTANTGDEFAMFTCKRKRIVVRGNAEWVPLKIEEIIHLRKAGYRWSGHTHPGYADTDLLASDGDKFVLKLFEQTNSAIYNAVGHHRLIE